MKYLIVALLLSSALLSIVPRGTFAAEICWVERDGSVTCTGTARGKTKNCFFEQTSDGPILVCY